ncbi:MAG TPA: hypothetical protein VMW55_09810 [Nitrosopumilaceae archaeon]|nr:hypothetical protein [Nitrosopumilaceae archaeon]
MFLILFVSFVVIVFANSYIPPSYDVIVQQQEPIDIEKRLDILYEHLIPCKDEENHY